MRKGYLLASCGLAIFTYQGGRDIMHVLLPAIQTDFGLSYAMAGIVAASYDWGNVALLVLGGFLSDRYGKERAIFVAASWFVFVNAAAMLSTASWPLISLRFAAGFAFGVYFVAGNSLLADAFPAATRGRAIGLHYAGGSAGRLIIPVLAGGITASAGWRPAFLPLSIAGAGAVVLFSFLIGARPSSVPALGSPWSNLWHRSLKNRNFVKITSVYCLVMFTNMEILFIPLYLVRTWGLTLFQASLYIGLMALVAIAGAPLLGEMSDRLGWKRTVLATLLVDGLFLAILPFVPPGPGLVAVLLVLGTVNCAPYVVISVETRVSEDSQTGMSLGLFHTAGIASVTVLSVVGGYIADLAGLSATFVFISCAAFAAAAAMGASKLGRLTYCNTSTPGAASANPRGGAGQL